MPKQPKIRPSYRPDAQYFLRLAHAVEWDEAKPLEWRQRIASLCRDLAREFQEAPDGQEITKSPETT